ncbi:Structural maintenance of chromosomes protein 6B [Linum perenne]
MGDAGFVPGFSGPATRTSGTLKRIRVENFMCHSNLQIELGPRVNFITGQNGSGKSAILTAICVAFGSRAKATQRASGLKDFIKTGCSHAVVEVEIKNEGDDAFKHDLYGDAIILERRITQSGSSLTLKDHRGMSFYFNELRRGCRCMAFEISILENCVNCGETVLSRMSCSGLNTFRI